MKGRNIIRGCSTQVVLERETFFTTNYNNSLIFHGELHNVIRLKSRHFNRFTYSITIIEYRISIIIFTFYVISFDIISIIFSYQKNFKFFLKSIVTELKVGIEYENFCFASLLPKWWYFIFKVTVYYFRINPSGWMNR